MCYKDDLRPSSLPSSAPSPHLLIPHSLSEEARSIGVVGEETGEEGNQYLACLEKQQYFNLEMPEETAGAPQAYANHMQSYGNLESKPALPPTWELGLREPQGTERLVDNTQVICAFS